MKKLPKFLFAVMLSITALFYTACEQNAEPDLHRVGWGYYPLTLGQYQLYDVYRINYNFSTENDTLQYELKELVADYYLNQENDTVYILQRLRRTSAANRWELDSAYLVQRTSKWLLQTINNRPIVQLKFPVAEGLVWNANMMNASPADSFEITSIGSPYEIKGQIYENSLRIVQEDFENAILGIEDQRQEIYAYGHGLVYKYVKKYNYCTAPECENQQIINTGLYLEMTLKETGTEPL